jgi:hypothetical protein
MSNTLYLGKHVQIAANNVSLGSATVDMTSATLSVATPVNPSNAVTKAYVDDQVSNLLSNISPSALDSFTEVVSAFQVADSNLNGAISALALSASTNLATEVSRAQSAESALIASMSAEVSRAQSAESALDVSLSAEVSRAQSAESALIASMSAEVSRAQSAEAAANARIDALCMYFFKNATQF